MKTDKPFWKSLLTGLAVALVIIVYAYGFQVTEVNFEETRSENRLTQLTRIIRALAHPEIFEYEQEETNIKEWFFLSALVSRAIDPRRRTTRRSRKVIRHPQLLHVSDLIQLQQHSVGSLGMDEDVTGTVRVDARVFAQQTRPRCP